MMDAGGIHMGDTSRPGERLRLLRQIADALDVPISAFTGCGHPAPVLESPTAAECAAALAAFSRICDPDLRRQCLHMLERCAEA